MYVHIKSLYFIIIIIIIIEVKKSKVIPVTGRGGL
jgi:hypothetical protein